MPRVRHTSRKGFSLLELVIVVVIIGIIAAIAIPRMSRGTAGAADSAVAGDLAVIRNAIDLYAAEHDGKMPILAKITNQLTMYSDSSNSSDPVSSKDGTHPYGPYLRAVPTLPTGVNKGQTGFTATLPLGSDKTAGWYFDASTGAVKANMADAELDNAGKQYNLY
jgi:prepilin-type N-terminal cleavage/methylation domain-containing protein